MENNTSPAPLESTPTPVIAPEPTASTEPTAEPVVEVVAETVHAEPKVEEPIIAATPDLTQTEIAAPQYAGGWIRLLAYIIDAIIIGLGLSIFRAIGGTALYNAMSVLGVVYLVVFMALKQQTPGMMALKLRLVSAESGTPNWWMIAIMRQVVGGLVCGITLGIGYLVTFFTDKKQGLHDMIAKTYVIKD
jgi:uncharacterized RDD family membrane protein YckC